MTTRVHFQSKSGTPVEGELAEPSAAGKAPAAILIQEWWGVNEHIKTLTERLASAGFLVLAPDLYHGRVTKSADEAGKWMGELDTMKAVDEIAGAVAFAKEHARSNGKVGVTGFCMGGALAYASACHIPGLSGVVSFYGLPPAEKVDYTKVTAPVQAHVAKRDQWVTVAKAEAVKAQIPGGVDLHVYDADHAFVNETRPEVYSPANANLAWGRMVDFFKKHLA